MSQERFVKSTRRALSRHGNSCYGGDADCAGRRRGSSGRYKSSRGTTKLAQADADIPAQLMSRAKAGDWTKPAAMAIPKEGYLYA